MDRPQSLYSTARCNSARPQAVGTGGAEKAESMHVCTTEERTQMGPQCQGCARGTSSQTCTGSAWHITRVTRATDSPVLHLSPASKGGPRAGKGQDRHP
jgi:hypothetical protein